MTEDARNQILELLTQALANNLGQKLTPELATGIATLVNQKAIELVSAGSSAE